MHDRAKRQLARVAVCLWTAMWLLQSSCTRNIHWVYEAGDAYHYVPPAGPAAGFAYDGATEVTLRPSSLELPGYQVFELSYPSTGDNGQQGNRVDALYYRSQRSGAQKFVAVLPIWGSHTYPPEKITEGYARHTGGQVHIVRVLGVNALFEWETLASLTDEQEFKRLASLMADRFRYSVIDTLRLFDWAAQQPEIDASRLAIVGFSMSALVAALVLANDPRVDTGVLMMGGANPGDIFADCVGRAGAVRDNAMQRFGWTREQYREFFTELFHDGNPAEYTGRYDPRRILMIDAAHDDCMPASSREALWEATGRPERYSFLYPHKKAFLSLTPLGFNYSRGKIYRFLDRNL